MMFGHLLSLRIDGAGQEMLVWTQELHSATVSTVSHSVSNLQLRCGTARIGL